MLSEVFQRKLGLQGLNTEAAQTFSLLKNEARDIVKFYQAQLGEMLGMTGLERILVFYLVSSWVFQAHWGPGQISRKPERLLLAYTVDEITYNRLRSGPRPGGTWLLTDHEKVEREDGWNISIMPLQPKTFGYESFGHEPYHLGSNDHKKTTWSLHVRLVSELRESMNGHQSPHPVEESLPTIEPKESATAISKDHQVSPPNPQTSNERGPARETYSPTSLELTNESRFFLYATLSKFEYKIKRHLSVLPWGRRVLRYLRPKRPPGFDRIEWACSCGVLLHGDYEVASDESAEALQSLEHRLRTAASPSSDKRSSAPPSTSTPRAGATSSSSFSTGGSSVDVTDQRSFSRQMHRRSSSEHVDDEQHLQPETRTCFELCVNTKLRRTVLEELEITTQGGHRLIYNDHKLFCKPLFQNVFWFSH